MSPDLDTLRAYADGELSPQSRAEVEAAIARDPALRETAETMTASCLPYEAAFTHRPTPSTPARLTTRVEELVRVAEASREMQLVTAGGSGWGPGSPHYGFLWGCLTAIVLFAIYGGVMRLRQPTESIEPWVQKVSSYQSMYTRDTVVDDGTGPSQALVLKRRLQERSGMSLNVPDLTGEGLRFVRAQLLQFDGRPVLQLVYLPATGGPVALCLTQAATQTEHALTLEGLQVVTWESEGWAYALLGSQPLSKLREIRRALPAAII